MKCHLNLYILLFLFSTRAGKNDIDAIPISAEAYRRGFRAMSLCWGKILWSRYEGTVHLKAMKGDRYILWVDNLTYIWVDNLYIYIMCG